MSVTRVLLLSLIFLETTFAGSITLNPGSLLAGQAIFSGPVLGSVVNYTKTGSVLGSEQISGLSDIAESLTVLGGNLYVSDGAARVNRIDLASGNSIFSFSAGMYGLNGLGTYNGSLLTLTFYGTAVGVYSPAGLLQRSIPLSFLPSLYSWNGVTSDGTNLYLADYHSGNLYKYSSTGMLLGSIATGVAGLTGVAYDSSNNSLWISDSSTDHIDDLSTGGLLLSQFSTGSIRPSSGVAVVPMTTPEPAYGRMVALALAVGFGLLRLRVTR